MLTVATHCVRFAATALSAIFNKSSQTSNDSARSATPTLTLPFQTPVPAGTRKASTSWRNFSATFNARLKWWIAKDQELIATKPTNYIIIALSS
jgi:hypothetical protein